MDAYVGLRALGWQECVFSCHDTPIEEKSTCFLTLTKEKMGSILRHFPLAVYVSYISISLYLIARTMQSPFRFH